MDDTAQKIRALREDHDILQDEMATILKCNRGSISNYENGRNLPMEVIIAYCRYFNVSADWLLGLTTDRNPGGSDLAKKLDTLAQAAQQAGHEPLTADQLSGLLNELIAYYRHYAPAGDAPLNVLRAFLSAFRDAVTATGEVSTSDIVIATNAVASAGLQATDILYQYLEQKQAYIDHTEGLAEVRQPLERIRKNTLRTLADQDRNT